MSTKNTFKTAKDEQQFKRKVLEVDTKTITLDPNKPIQEQVIKIDNEWRNSNFNPQVKMEKQRAPKRKFSHAYKLQVLNTLDACKTAEERAALLRKEGLYYARISTWKKQFQNGKFVANKAPKSVLLTQQLNREVATLKKKLLQAEAIIDLQKKVSELLSINIREHDASEM